LLKLSRAADFSAQDEYSLELKIEKVFWRDELIVHSDGLKRMKFADGKLHSTEALVDEKSVYAARLGTDSHGHGFAFLRHDGIRIYDQANGELLRTLRYNNQDADANHSQSSTICLSPAADLLLTSDTRNVRVWDYGSGELAIRVPIVGSSAVGAAVQPEGKSTVIWGDKRLNMYVHPQRTVFGSTRGRLRTVDGIALDTEDAEGPVLVDQNMALLGSSSDLICRTFATLSRPMQREWDYRPVLYENYGSSMAIRDRLLVLWSAKANRIVSDDMTKKQGIYHEIDLSRVRWLRIAPDRQTLYVAMDEPIPGKRAGVRTIPLLKAISTEDWTVQWEWRESGGLLERPRSMMDLHFHQNSLVCLMEDGRGVWIDPKTGETRSSVSIPLIGVQKYCWVGEDQWAIGTTDGRIGVFHAESQSLGTESKIHRMPVTGVACMKDGTIVSCSKDGNLVFSKIEGDTLREVLRIPHENASIEEMHLDADRHFLFYRCRNEHLGRWLEIDQLRAEFANLGIDW
jgi:WD40 repeat protein